MYDKSVETTGYNKNIYTDNNKKLKELNNLVIQSNPNTIVELLEHDCVILIKNVTAEEADNIIEHTAKKLNLKKSLDTQSRFASIKGHRENIGDYFMSVNKRSDYQFIPPHSEGTYAMDMQLAALYCYENSTDGGHTILLNVNDLSNEWNTLRETSFKISSNDKLLSETEITALKMYYGINYPEDVLSKEDKVIKVIKEVNGVSIVQVLSQPKKSYSKILQRQVNAYWDNISSIDFDSALEYMGLLKHCGLLVEPMFGLDIKKLDNSSDRKIWNSKVKYEELFKNKITIKLETGDLIIQNNLTWTHSASNWTPNSGRRKVVAAFA